VVPSLQKTTSKKSSQIIKSTRDEVETTDEVSDVPEEVRFLSTHFLHV